jgi:16S rRNA (guanine(1405)-N(7))-methyltransferase
VEADALALVARASRKYRYVAPALAAAIAARELRKPTAAAAKLDAVRRALHGAVCAYRVGAQRYDRWLAELSAAADEPARRSACLAAMRGHASTNERLPILDAFYAAMLPGGLASVVDLGCGLNPLSVPWL